MATMIIGGEKYQMPIWLKARLLEVLEAEDAGVLKVESGTERGKWYAVRHDGHIARSCECDARVEKCAHKQAAERYLASVEVLGKAFAEDLPAHVEDELRGEEHERTMEEIADEIIAFEQDRKLRAGIAADLLLEEAQYQREVATSPAWAPESLDAVEDADSDPMDETRREKPVELQSCTCCGRLSKADVCAWCLGVAA